jgi:N6-L-threonylcarbamoyladenine synthase
LPDLCASYQEAVVDVLIRKSKWGLSKGGIKSLGLSGGVSNNGVLRDRFMDLGDRMGLPTFLARREHTGDNAGMIAFSRVFQPMDSPNSKVDIVPNATIDGAF